MSDPILDSIAKQMGPVIDQLLTQTNTQLPEDIFVGYFLPYFSGQREITSDQKVIGDWISVAKTPMASVDIVNDGGTVLYTVPPIFNTSLINANKQDRENSFSAIYNKFQLLNNNIPATANKYLMEQFSNKFGELDANTDVSEATAKWNNIFERYNIVPVVKETSVTVVLDEPEDDLEY